MKRMISLLCNKLMCFNAHHYVRRFDAYNEIIIAQVLNNLNLVKCTFNNSLCCYSAIFLNKVFFKRTAVDTYPDWYISFLGNINNSLYLVCSTDITWIDSNLVSPVLHCHNSHLIIEMYISNERYLYLLLYLFDCKCSFLSWNCASDDFTTGFGKLLNLCYCCSNIFCMCISH